MVARGATAEWVLPTIRGRRGRYTVARGAERLSPSETPGLPFLGYVLTVSRLYLAISVPSRAVSRTISLYRHHKGDGEKRSCHEDHPTKPAGGRRCNRRGAVAAAEPQDDCQRGHPVGSDAVHRGVAHTGPARRHRRHRRRHRHDHDGQCHPQVPQRNGRDTHVRIPQRRRNPGLPRSGHRREAGRPVRPDDGEQPGCSPPGHRHRLRHHGRAPR